MHMIVNKNSSGMNLDRIAIALALTLCPIDFMEDQKLWLPHCCSYVIKMQV